MRHIETSIHISSPCEEVWKNLTDISSYQKWNPFITKASGKIEVGERLSVHIEPTGKSGTTFRPHVVSVNPPNKFVWLGRLIIPGLFDGLHSFELIRRGEDTRLIQSEKFSGILVPPMWSRIEGPTRDGFERMNEALKVRCEAT